MIHIAPLSLRSALQPHTSSPDAKTRKLFTFTSPTTLSLRIDWSSLEGFLHCNRLARYKLIDSRISAPGPALTFGAAMHSALEIWYKFYPGHYPASDVITSTLQLCREAIDRTFAEHPGSTLTDWRTSEYCFECFLKYITDPSIRGETIKPAVHEDKQLVEFSFSIPIGETLIHPSVFELYGYGALSTDAAAEEAAVANGHALKCELDWTGIIDMVADINGEHWLVDHKTTSILSSDFFDTFDIAMQPVGYVNAARELLPALNIRGFLVNVLACRKPTKTGTGFEPLRRKYEYSDWHFAEWKADALGLIEEFLSNLHSNFFPKKTSWCSGKYGKCRYFNVCSLHPDHRAGILSSGEFVDNTWKPVE